MSYSLIQIIIIYTCGKKNKQLNKCIIKASIANSRRYSHSPNNGLTAPRLLFIQLSLNKKNDASLRLLITWVMLVLHLQVIKIQIRSASAKEL